MTSPRPLASLRARLPRLDDPRGVTKFGDIPDGGGHRFVGRQQGDHNKRAIPGVPRGADYKPRTGTAHLHTVIDDHSRLACVEICTDEKAPTAARALERAVAWFAPRGVNVQRVLSYNGPAYVIREPRTRQRDHARPRSTPRTRQGPWRRPNHPDISTI